MGSVWWCFAEFHLVVSLVAFGVRRTWRAGAEVACLSQSRLPMASSSADEVFYPAVPYLAAMVTEETPAVSMEENHKQASRERGLRLVSQGSGGAGCRLTCRHPIVVLDSVVRWLRDLGASGTMKVRFPVLSPVSDIGANMVGVPVDSGVADVVRLPTMGEMKKRRMSTRTRTMAVFCDADLLDVSGLRRLDGPVLGPEA